MTATPPLSPASHLPDKFTIESPELRAAVEAHTPIRFFPHTNEPYIPLPAPFERFHLGCARQSDLPGDDAMMNDLRLMRTVHGPPFPNPLLNAQRHLVRQRAKVFDLFAQFAQGGWRPAASSPFDLLREVREDGTTAYVGQVTIDPVPGVPRRTPVSDDWEEWRLREPIFEIGAVLNLAYHNRGLASAAVHLLITQWAVPQMGATEIRAQCFLSNTASVRLWQKHGFVEDVQLRGHVTLPESKGGGVEEDCCLLWRLE